MIEKLGSYFYEKRLSSQTNASTDLLHNSCFCPMTPNINDTAKIVNTLRNNIDRFVFAGSNLTTADIDRLTKHEMFSDFHVSVQQPTNASDFIAEPIAKPDLPIKLAKQLSHTNIPSFEFYASAQAHSLLLEPTDSTIATKSISLLFLPADASLCYYHLMWANEVSPALILISHGYSERADSKQLDFADENSLFAKFVTKHPSKAYPKYIAFSIKDTEKKIGSRWDRTYAPKQAEIKSTPNTVGLAIYKRSDDRFLWPIRILQVLPFTPAEAISTRDVAERIQKHFSLNLKMTQVTHQLRSLTSIDLVDRPDASESTHCDLWYRNRDIDIDLANSNQEGVVGLSILDKIAEQLLPRESSAVHQLAVQQRNRLAMITDNDNAQKIAERFSYADFVLNQQVDNDIARDLNTAILNNYPVSLLYKPRDTEALRVDVGVPLGIVQKNSLQTLVIELRPNENINEPHTARIALDRIQKLHFRRHKGDIEAINSAPSSSHKNEFWHQQYNPTERFQHYLTNHQGGLSNGKNHNDASGVTTIKLVAHVYHHLATHLKTSKISDDQQLIPLQQPPYPVDKEDADLGAPWYQLTASVPHSEQLNWWVMSWAERIVIVEPNDMQAAIAKRLKAASANYL